MKWTIIKVILFFIMCSMAFAQSSTEQGTEIPFDGSSMAASIAAKQKLYDDAVEAFKTQKAGQLVKLLHGAFDVKITNTTFDHEQAGDKIPFSVTVLVSINEERYAAAMTELEKELTVLGAKRTDYENYRSLSIIQPNNEVVNGPLLKVYYEFSEASYHVNLLQEKRSILR